MLTEECAAFSRDEKDVGCIQSLQLKIRLSDPTPVRCTYTSVPQPLQKEVKEYLEDLLNRTESKVPVPILITNSLFYARRMEVCMSAGHVEQLEWQCLVLGTGSGQGISSGFL